MLETWFLGGKSYHEYILLSEESLPIRQIYAITGINEVGLRLEVANIYVSDAHRRIGYTAEEPYLSLSSRGELFWLRVHRERSEDGDTFHRVGCWIGP